MTDLEVFRADVRAWLETNAPLGIRDLPPDESLRCWGGRQWIFRNEDERLWLMRMAARGWTAPEWPVEYGGGGLSRAEADILDEERKRVGASMPLYSLGIWMLGPALLRFGSEAQKREHLPPIARGEIRWAQGYSEPGAGSDLASVQTRGEDHGDHFLVNGSKTWTSHAEHCDKIFALVRTEPGAPKHLGISFLLIDMADPGVTTRPIRLVTGDSLFAETFFENVRVSKENLVGERGRGWDVAKYLLAHERGMMSAKPITSMGEQTIAERALASLGVERLRQEGVLRAEILRYEADAWTMAIALERNRQMELDGTASVVAGSVHKLAATELNRRRTELMMSIDGVAALQAAGAPAQDWLHAPSLTIAGGSSEIQLNIIARRALALPDG